MGDYGRDRAWPFAKGGGWTIGVATAVLAAALLLWQQWPHPLTLIIVGMALAFWLLILYFFRDPNRQVINEPGLVIGPADGEVVEIVRETESRFLNAEVVRVSLFLSVLDVHIQRIPIGGEVRLVQHQPGQFLQAFKPEASDVNEFIGMVIESAYGRVLIKQIAGILARRCVNYAQEGDQVTTGQRFGLIRFSSRVDLFLPPNAQLLVKIGDKVTGGVTAVAHLAENSEQTIR